MSDLGDDSNGNGNGETDEERRWREHSERFDMVNALERRLGSIEVTMHVRMDTMDAKLDRVLGYLEARRDEVAALHRDWVRIIDIVHDTQKRIADLELALEVARRPARRSRK